MFRTLLALWLTIPALSFSSQWETYPFESKHPYLNQTDQVFKVRHIGAARIKIEFSRIGLARGDYLAIRDANGREIQRLKGPLQEKKLLTKSISGNSASVRLVSDASLNDYGFSVERIQVELSQSSQTALLAEETLPIKDLEKFDLLIRDSILYASVRRDVHPNNAGIFTDQLAQFKLSPKGLKKISQKQLKLRPRHLFSHDRRLLVTDHLRNAIFEPKANYQLNLMHLKVARLVSASKDLLLATDGIRIQIIDTSRRQAWEPLLPKKKLLSNRYVRQFAGIAVINERYLVTQFVNRFHVVDLSDPVAPTKVTQFEVSKPAANPLYSPVIPWSDFFLFAADDQLSLYDPSNGFELAQVKLPEEVTSSHVSARSYGFRGDVLFIAGEKAIHQIKVSAKSLVLQDTIRLRRNADFVKEIRHVWVENHRLYVVWRPAPARRPHPFLLSTFQLAH